jgi:hypothetical protein
MNANQLQAEIERRRAALLPALREIEALEQQHAEAASREFIAANRITRDQVEQASRHDGPWHGTVWAFGKWMQANGCTKAWCEWNGRLYPSAEIKAGSIRREAPGLWKHVSA